MDVFSPSANAFRFYDDDAGEATSTPLAAQDTNVTINVDAGNVPFQLRYRIQATNAVAGATTDDYALQRNHNGGGFATITGSTSAIISSTSGLTNDGATTNRGTNGITDGTGSFVASEQSTDGIVDNWQLAASNFTEMVWGGTVVAADVSNGQTITFRVSLNGGAPGMTNAVTPTITIQKAVSVAIDSTSASATGAVGSLGKTISRALNSTGIGSTGSVGTLVPSVAYSVALTNVLGTGAVGSLAKQIAVALNNTSVLGTGAVGTVLAAPSYTIAISGEVGTGGIGSLVPSFSLALNSTGATGSGAVGTLAPRFSLALSGNTGTGAVNTFSKSLALAVSGLAGTGSVGTLTPAEGVSVAITGNMGVGYAGDLDVPAALTSYNGVSMAGNVAQHGGVSRPNILNRDQATKQYRQYDFKPDGVNRETYLIDGDLP